MENPALRALFVGILLGLLIYVHYEGWLSSFELGRSAVHLFFELFR
jgi:hypothetical protein